MVEKIIIIGSGPAAYSAALYTKDYNPLIIRGDIIGDIGPGGQLTTTTHVDNYPGFPKGVQGPKLMDLMHDQMGNLRQVDKTVLNITKKDWYFVINTKKNTYTTECVIIGTGASAKRLYVEGTTEYWQKGISACAVCDGYFYKGKICCVIGGGDSAMEEALFLSKVCNKVYLIHRSENFRCRKDKLEKVRRSKNIEILTSYNLESAHGDGEKLNLIKLSNNKELVVDGLFFGIGHIPNTKFLEENFSNILDNEKLIKVDEKCKTEVEGIFACGDVFDKIYRQAVTAASSGCIAGLSAAEYLESKK